MKLLLLTLVLFLCSIQTQQKYHKARGREQYNNNKNQRDENSYYQRKHTVNKEEAQKTAQNLRLFKEEKKSLETKIASLTTQLQECKLLKMPPKCETATKKEPSQQNNCNKELSQWTSEKTALQEKINKLQKQCDIDLASLKDKMDGQIKAIKDSYIESGEKNSDQLSKLLENLRNQIKSSQQQRRTERIQCQSDTTKLEQKNLEIEAKYNDMFKKYSEQQTEKADSSINCPTNPDKISELQERNRILTQQNEELTQLIKDIYALKDQ